MAVKLISIGTSMNTNAGVYKADNISDMNSMSLDNIEFGSECLVIATGVRYILNSNGEWKKQPGIVIGSDLPEVDPSDEGKVLTVDNNGAWIAEDLPVELPAITGADEGKVLTVDNNGTWAAEDLPEELPEVGVSDKNKFLHTNNSTGATEWVAAPTELPSVSSVDNGQVLTVVNGAWDKVDPDTIVLHVNEETFALDKTWQEITNLLAAGKRLVFFFTNTETYGTGGGTQATIIATTSLNDEYAVWSFGYQISGSQPQWYDFRAFADTANDYPCVD